MKEKRKMLITLVLLLSIICVTIGVTFAAFSFVKQGTVENTLETGTVTLTYTEGKTGILLNEVYPISDERGKVLVGEDNVFDFTIQANLSRTMSIGYEVTAVKIPITDMEPLLDNEVKLYLERAIDPDTTYQEVLAPSNFMPREEQTEIGSPVGSMILDTGTFTESGTTIHNYRLRLWVDESVKILNGESRKYGVKINVYAKQDIHFVEEDTYTFDATTGTITKYNDTKKNVVIPSQIDNVEVITIGTGAFANKGLTSVTIPNGVTTIKENAFDNNELTAVTIPETVTTIETNAFSNNPLNEINNLSGNSFNWQDITNKDDVVVNLPRNKNITAIFQYNQTTGSSTYCVTGEESTCQAIAEPKVYQQSTIIKYKVNNRTQKYFYVIKDNGDTLTLQQRDDTTSKNSWYKNDNGESDATLGPLNILSVLESATVGWTNVLDQTYIRNNSI